ncbi:YSIRK-type signal peptide-containing protein [Staphylococcus kloosii]|uniref:YSIRK-type signal peptide-containing protein n=1 Tax=Staphylococcus kloosii TaxID=29384 RepID=UPI0028A3634C|nr:YSIRK-type signal peptide-containing protein [Staphylococcus kloosii]MDT3960498.1 YSIRK-type signal peptide-containing protein [Staphylococcus kloosii]
MKQHQDIAKYSIRKLAKGAGALLISSVLLFGTQNSASAAEQNNNSASVNEQTVVNAPDKAAQKKDTTNPEIQSIKMDKREYAPGEIAIATLIVKDESNLADVSIGFTNTTQVGTPALSGVADKANIEKINDSLWKVTIQINIPDKIGDTSYQFSAAIVDDAAQNGTTIAPELAPTSLNVTDLSFKVVNKNVSNVDTELPQFDSVKVDKQTYAPGDVIKAQLKISDESTLKEVSVGFENDPDKGLIGLNKVADLSNVQRNSEGQWVVNVEIPIPSDLEDGSYKFSHISATDEFGNAFGLIDVPNFETKFTNVKFNVAKSGTDKKTVAQAQPQANDQNKDTDIINTNTTDAKKSAHVEQQDNNVATPEQPLDNNTNQTDKSAPQDSDKLAQNKDVEDANAQNNDDAAMTDQGTDNAVEPKAPTITDQSNNNVNKVAPQSETPKALTPNADTKDKSMNTPSQQHHTKQPDDVTTTPKDTDKAQPQVKGDAPQDNKVQAQPQNKNAPSSTAKDVNKQTQSTDKKSADTQNPEPKIDKPSNVDNGQKGTGANAKIKPQTQTKQSQSKAQQAAAKSHMQNTTTQGNIKDQSTTKHQTNNKMSAEMSKQTTTKVADSAKSNKTQQSVSNKAVATPSQDKVKAAGNNKKGVTDKQKQTASKNKANKDAKSVKQLPQTGMMNTMRDYFFVGVLMAVGITVIMFRRFSVFK